MIRQTKNDNIPQSLKDTKRYDGEDVKMQLLNDQHSKCYVCERIVTTDFEVEHLRSQTNFRELIQDWNNLFLSCKYCNAKKSSYNDDILNPLTTDIENVIRQEFDYAAKKAKFTGTVADRSIDETIKLLNSIYNGTGRCRKIKEERFINSIISTLNDFNKLVIDYLDNPNDDNRKVIEEELDITREALGFKYWIIKSNPILERVFAGNTVWNK